MGYSSKRWSKASAAIAAAALGSTVTILGMATSASAAALYSADGLNQGVAPTGTTILAVDINGAGGTGGTETKSPGFQGWTVATSTNSTTQSYTPTSGVGAGITTKVTAEGADSGGNIVSRDRGTYDDSSAATSTTLVNYGELYRDFLNEPSNTSNPTTGANALQIAFTGLTANTSYALTFFSYDSQQASSVVNYGTGTVNSAVSFTPGTIYGTVQWNNVTPITSSASTNVAQINGVTSVNPEYFATTFDMTSDSTGSLTLYQWAQYGGTIDGNAAAAPQQNAGVLDGFIISSVSSTTAPEPASFALLGLALPVLGLVRRRQSLRK